jgi:Ala-tRNA(Pro) deacylase
MLPLANSYYLLSYSNHAAKFVGSKAKSAASAGLSGANLGISKTTPPSCQSHTASKRVDFNSCSEGNVDHKEATTPPEILRFLIAQRDKCLDKIADVGLSFSHPYFVYHHPPVYTCEEAEKYCPNVQKHVRDHQMSDSLVVGSMKNLFLRDKKKHFFLVTALDETQIELKKVCKQIGGKGGSVSFGKEDMLKEHLGVIPGSVTPFGLLNDKDSKVTFFVDENFFEQCDFIAIHPNANNSTVAMHKDDFKRFIEAETGHVLNILPKS